MVSRVKGDTHHFHFILELSLAPGGQLILFADKLLLEENSLTKLSGIFLFELCLRGLPVLIVLPIALETRKKTRFNMLVIYYYVVIHKHWLLQKNGTTCHLHSLK